MVNASSWAIHLKGISAIQAASFMASLGDPAAYSDGAQVFRRTGLVSGRHDSGTRQKKGKGRRVTKVGDVYLRRAVMNLVVTVTLHQPVLHRALKRLQATKHPGIARVAVARQMVGQFWATMRDQRAVQLVPKRGGTM